MWCATLFCTYLVAPANAALARVTLAKMSLALAVQMKGLGWALWCTTYRSMANSNSATLVKRSRLMPFSEMSRQD